MRPLFVLPRRLSPDFAFARRFFGALAVLLLVGNAALAQAQTVMTSNLGQPTDFSDAISSGQWIASEFTTGNSAAGWTLNSIDLKIGDPVVASGGFFVALYSTDHAIPDAFPDVVLETLTGTNNPTSAGTYTFTSAGFQLAPNTTYSVVTGITSGSGNYSIPFASGSAHTGPWSMPDLIFLLNGSSSISIMHGDSLQFSVSATASAIPEPTTYAAIFSVIALSCAGFTRYRQRAACSAASASAD